MPDLLLASDIGATNTRLRLVDAADLTSALDEHVYGKGAPVGQAIAAFLDRIGERRREIRAACFGVAGRVVDGDVRMTNRPDEVITDERLSAALGIDKGRVVVVNDMVAHMSGVEVSETILLRAGRPCGGVEGIVMPGTGLGIGWAVRDAGGRRVAMPSEGGHLDFGPPAQRHDRLLAWGRGGGGRGEGEPGRGGAGSGERTSNIERPTSKSGDMLSGTSMFEVRSPANLSRVSWESFVSGPGLARIYACLAGAAPAGSIRPEDVTAAALGKGGDLDHAIAAEAARTFVALSAARAGNLCLDILASRGIYLGGNLLNMLHYHDPGRFIAVVTAEFDACGPEVLRQTMQEVPLYLIRAPDSGLRGAAALAKERMG